MTSTPPGVTDPADAMRDAVVAVRKTVAATPDADSLLPRLAESIGAHLTTLGLLVEADKQNKALRTSLHIANGAIEGLDARIADLEAKLAQAAENERDRLSVLFEDEGHWLVAKMLRRVGGAMFPAERAKARAASAFVKPAKGEGRA